VEAEVLDLDEDAFRSDRIAVRLHAAAKTLGEPTYVQAGKMSFERVEDDEVRDEVAATVAMEVRRQKEAVWVLGSGSTVEAIGRRLGVAKTVLGVDVLVDGRLAAKDAGEAGLLRILDEHKERPRRLVVTPIGAQGFILGRGNLQLSPAVVRAIGIENVTVVATPAKLARTPALRVDTGDPELDRAFATKGYLPVVVAFNTTRLVKVEG
jgi:predicted polyphosphate/ATP-dependent NAD kinase